MAEENTPDEGATPEPDTQNEPDSFKSEESKTRVLADLAAERDKRQQLEARLKEIEDRDKTEAERLTERLTSAEKAAAEHQSALLRYRVGIAKGLPADLVERLRGSTEEELSADADALLAILPAPRATRGATDQGPRTETPPEASINDLLRAARGR